MSCYVALCCGMAGCVVSVFVFSVSSPLFPLLPPLLLSFVGGVRGSARAALRARTLSPNTIVSLLFYCLFFFLSATPRFSLFRLSVCLEWRCVFTMCRCVVLA